MTDPQDTPMGQLMEVRNNLLSKLDLKLRIPRWDDPQILVHYKVLDQVDYGSSLASMLDVDSKDKKARAEASLNANRDMLIKACTKIELKGSEINGEFEGFGKELAEAVGLPLTSARSVCEFLFIADGDLYQHVNRLIEWSGFSGNQLEDDFSGE